MRKPPWGECQRCGFKFRLTQLKTEWTGLRVCKGTGTNRCWDPRPKDTRPPKYKPEGLIRPDASPATEPVFGRASRDDL
jgi:hypothetical protein